MIENYKLNDIAITKLSDNDYYIININNTIYYTKHMIFVNIILRK